MAYANTTQLAGKLKVNESNNQDDLQRVLDAATLEIDTEIGRSLDVSATVEELALAATVCLSRAQDLWTIEGLPVGVIGLGAETPLLTPRDSWARHAVTLSPLKEFWGLA